MDDMAKRLRDKIMNFLASKEGCTMDFSAEDQSVTVQDSMGFRFEVSVKSAGRLQSWSKENEE